MTREIIKKIRMIFNNGCLSDDVDKCLNDGNCDKCEDDALEKLIDEYNKNLRSDVIDECIYTLIDIYGVNDNSEAIEGLREMNADDYNSCALCKSRKTCDAIEKLKECCYDCTDIENLQTYIRAGELDNAKQLLSELLVDVSIEEIDYITMFRKIGA